MNWTMLRLRTPRWLRNLCWIGYLRPLLDLRISTEEEFEFFGVISMFQPRHNMWCWIGDYIILAIYEYGIQLGDQVHVRSIKIANFKCDEKETQIYLSIKTEQAYHGTIKRPGKQYSGVRLFWIPIWPF
jgi:hypothetical protein